MDFLAEDPLEGVAKLHASWGASLSGVLEFTSENI